MSDILIRGMEMPKGCDECTYNSGIYCNAMPIAFCGYTEDEDRPNWCPLIEVPPHGDLIDRDALIDTLSSSDRDIYVKCMLEEDATVVIEGNMDGNKVMK